LLLVARDARALAAVAAETPDAATLSLDISVENAASLVADEARRLGGADILINNAAIQGPIGRAVDADLRAVEQTIRLDLLAPMALIQALAPQMTAKGAGWIVNISGGGAVSPRPMFAAYGSAKAALVRLSETLAAELAADGVRVNAVAPGAFASGMTAETVAAGEAASTESAAARRLLESNDDAAARKAADLVSYLVLGEGRNITGRLISAVWDPWPGLHERIDELLGSDIYTVRRITPADRGRDWSR